MAGRDIESRSVQRPVRDSGFVNFQAIALASLCEEISNPFLVDAWPTRADRFSACARGHTMAAECVLAAPCKARRLME